MKRLVLLSCLLAAVTLCPAQVKPGIETLRDGGFAQLRGKRVGLITNPTGVDRNLVSTIDILHQAPDVELTALFAPEHGVRGDVHAGDHVDNFTDPATGVTGYSIYGKSRKPSPEMLENVDVLVYDIQDNGCRSFTFISTMGLAMQACAELGKEFVVLDRPNPVGGDKVEGCLVEDSCVSFVSQFPIPYLYGLTPGELALYLNGEGLVPGGAKTQLTVVPMEGWKRSMDYADTGMPWVLPSPHMPTAETSLLYPASGILGELNYMNIGVGYTLPFKLFCSSWAQADSLCTRLRAMEIPGTEFRPIHIKPYYGFGKGEDLQGVEVYITDRETAPLTLIQFYVMEAIAEMYPDHKPFETADQSRLSMFDKVVGSKDIRRLFGRDYKVADMLPVWNRDASDFRERSAKYRLYQ